MGIRREARECALHILYTLDVCKMSVEASQACFWESKKASSEVIEFASRIVKGTSQNLSKIDGYIVAVAENWALDRMASLDRNIIRQATYEMLFLKEIPPKVIINEAVELAKKYSTPDSGKFVNGILDKIKENIEKDDQEKG